MNGTIVIFSLDFLCIHREFFLFFFFFSLVQARNLEWSG